MLLTNLSGIKKLLWLSVHLILNTKWWQVGWEMYIIYAILLGLFLKCAYVRIINVLCILYKIICVHHKEKILRDHCILTLLFWAFKICIHHMTGKWNNKYIKAILVHLLFIFPPFRYFYPNYVSLRVKRINLLINQADILLSSVQEHGAFTL